MRVLPLLAIALLTAPRGGAQEAASAQQPGLAEGLGAARASVAGVAAAQTLHGASSLLPAAQAAHASSLRLRHAVARRRWKADLVVVVTWHNKSIDWLASTFPLEHTSFVLYSKGGLKRCDTDVPPTLAHAVVACHEMHNAGGREAHTVAQFIVSHYHNLPRLTYFSQDHGHFAKTAALRNITTAAAFEAWAARAEALPFSSRETCLCEIIVEQTWTLERYGHPLYAPMRWFMEAFLDHDVAASNWTSVRWPANADVLVPATAIRGRALEVYKLMLLIFNGTKPAAHGITMPSDTKVLVSDDTRLVAMNQMGHVFERLWFAVFDVDFSPLQADYDARAPAAGAGDAAGRASSEAEIARAAALNGSVS